MSGLAAQVLIVGGGPVGLTASALLGDLGVDSILVERRDGSSKLAKAHYLNSRAMEIFASLGFGQAVYDAGTPLENMGTVSWYTSLGGDEPSDRRRFMSLDAFGGAGLQADYERTSASRPGNLPQKHLEPLLRELADERNPGAVLFEHELVGIEQDDAGVTATVRGPDGELAIRAAYAIGADGGRTVGAAVGIELQGLPPFMRAISIHIAADLSEWLQEDDSLVRLVTRPDENGTMFLTGFAAMGPDRWDRHSEQWVVNVMAPVGSELDKVEWTDALALAHVRELLKLPKLEAEVLGIGHWDVESVLADRYRAGRVLVAGDAAHRHPPTTGLGLNSGVADVHNLAWKLAAVLKGQAADSLLDSYQPERFPVAVRNVQWSMLTALNHVATQAGWGFVPDLPPELNALNFHATLMDSPDGAARLARLREFLGTQRMEYQARDVEMGYDYYDGGAVVQDGTPAPEHDPVGVDYRQTSRPGHRMPHAWLERDGERVATHQLLEPGAFLLLAGEAGEDWCAAAGEASDRLGVEVVAARAGEPGADLVDAEGAWRELRGHDSGGTVLVRPDGHVAYREATASPDPTAALVSALEAVLGRSL